MVIKLAIDIYRFLFARPLFIKLNKLLFQMSLRGLGVLNYESEKLSGESNFLQNSLGNLTGGCVLDVGANIGNYARRVRDVNSNLKIFCFEPHPKTYGTLVQNTRDFVSKAINAAVGAAAGSLNLYDYSNNDGSSHATAYREVIEQIRGQTATSHLVPVTTIDEFIDQNEINSVSLLKIDTEGHEMDVLLGAMQSIRANKIDIIHFEFNEMNVISRHFFKDFLDALPDFDFFRLLPSGLLPISAYDPVMCEIFAYQNIVAFRKRRHPEGK